MELPRHAELSQQWRFWLEKHHILDQDEVRGQWKIGQ
jgi:hypothetical protein